VVLLESEFELQVGASEVKFFSAPKNGALIISRPRIILPIPSHARVALLRIPMVRSAVWSLLQVISFWKVNGDTLEKMLLTPRKIVRL
jgi:hypothetical protein